MVKKGRRSTPEEKLAAVRMLEAGRTADEIARILDASRGIVYRWKQVYARHGAGCIFLRGVSFSGIPVMW
jgi:transposase-like protein